MNSVCYSPSVEVRQQQPPRRNCKHGHVTRSLWSGMDVCIIACYYTDVHASGHGFYTVQSRNEAYKTVQNQPKKIYGQTKGGRSHHRPPLNTPLQALNCLSIHATYCVIVAGASPRETKMWAAVRENGDFLTVVNYFITVVNYTIFVAILDSFISN